MKRALLLACFLGACNRPTPAASKDRSALVATPHAGDEVVATVGEVPIYASDVRVQAQAQGVDAQQALSVLVDAEVLAQAALARGLLSDPDVREAARQAEVRRLLHGVFEAKDTPDQIPDSEYEKLYAAEPLRFNHDDAVEVWHLLDRVPEAAPPEAWNAARARMSALRDAAIAAPTDEAFAALAKTVDPPLRAEHFTFPRHGSMVEPFAEAAFALAAPGNVSGLVQTVYGIHLIRLVKRVPAVHESLAQAKPELHDAALIQFRQRDFDDWMRELADRGHVEVHADRLSRLESAP
jgi:hypothetical protein